MRVLKVVAEGQITSFRYPHFLLGTQPTFEMPPPATLYGHICSALGYWFEPSGIKFGIHFQFEKKIKDVESTILIEPRTGKLRGTKWPKVQEGQPGPLVRELLFRPKLTFYVNQPRWEQSFHSPAYPVTLGRSQDLFTYTSVEVLELESMDHAYFENTLAPFIMARRITSGVVVLMPRFLDWSRNRVPVFSRYVILRHRVHSRDFLWLEGEERVFWVDPTSAEHDGDFLGIPLLCWDQAESM